MLEKFVEQPDFNTAVIDFKEFLSKERKLSIYKDEVFVFIGGDTRPSTKKLLDLVAKGVNSQNGKVVDFGLTTTPQLQYYGNFKLIHSLPFQ